MTDPEPEPTFTPEQETELLQAGAGGLFAVGYARGLDAAECHEHHGFFGSNLWALYCLLGVALGFLLGYTLAGGAL